MKTSVCFCHGIAFIVLLGASAMNPNPNPYQVEQPDGSTITVQMVLKNAKKNDRSGSENVTRLSARLESEGSRAVIGGGDGNSRNYAARGMKGSGQNMLIISNFIRT